MLIKVTKCCNFYTLLTILILYWFIGDLNGLGHLPEFADQIEPETSLALAEIVNKCRCMGRESKKIFGNTAYLNEWAVNEYAENIPYLYL